VPNFGDAVIFAAGFGGTVGVEVVDGTDDDVGSTLVSPEVCDGTLVEGSTDDDPDVGTVTDALGVGDAATTD